MFQSRVTDMWRRQTGFLRRTMVPVTQSPTFKLTGLSSMNRVCFQCVGLMGKINSQLLSFIFLLGHNITHFQEEGRMNPHRASILQLAAFFKVKIGACGHVMKIEKLECIAVKKKKSCKVCVFQCFTLSVGLCLAPPLHPPLPGSQNKLQTRL